MISRTWLPAQGNIRCFAAPVVEVALGLDVPSFQQCLDGGRHEEAIREDIEAGLWTGVRANDSPVKMLARDTGHLGLCWVQAAYRQPPSPRKLKHENRSPAPRGAGLRPCLCGYGAIAMTSTMPALSPA
jgi:hypothetical protein